MTIPFPSKDSATEKIAIQYKEIATLITRHTDGKGDGFHPTAIDRLDFARESNVSATLTGVSTPMHHCSIAR